MSGNVAWTDAAEAAGLGQKGGDEAAGASPAAGGDQETGGTGATET